MPAEKWGSGGAGGQNPQGRARAQGLIATPGPARRGCGRAEVPRGGRRGGASRPCPNPRPRAPAPPPGGGGLDPERPAPAPAPPRPARALRGGGRPRLPGAPAIGDSGRRREEKSNKRALRQPRDLGKGEGGGVRAGTDTQTETPIRTHTLTPPPSTLGAHNFGSPEPRGAVAGSGGGRRVRWGAQGEDRARDKTRREGRKRASERASGDRRGKGTEAREEFFLSVPVSAGAPRSGSDPGGTRRAARGGERPGAEGVRPVEVGEGSEARRCRGEEGARRREEGLAGPWQCQSEPGAPGIAANLFGPDLAPRRRRRADQ